MPTRVVNLRREAYDIYIGRGSEWGNPYSHRSGTKAEHRVATREEAIEQYRRHLWNRIRTEGWKLAQLQGKTLGCYCKPQPCHGDVLATAADWAVQQNERDVIAEILSTFDAKEVT